jgi:hypothetical protein
MPSEISAIFNQASDKFPPLSLSIHRSQVNCEPAPSEPTILHGTKDLVIKLSKLQLQHGHKFYIAMGNIVGYSPSIPIDKCIDITCELYMQHYHKGETPTTKQALHEADIFMKSLHEGNKELILQYNDKLYSQTRGLAMGVADSPD